MGAIAVALLRLNHNSSRCLISHQNKGKKMKLTCFVDQDIAIPGGKGLTQRVTTRFEGIESAKRFAFAVGGTVRAPKCASDTMGQKLFRAIGGTK